MQARRLLLSKQQMPQQQIPKSVNPMTTPIFLTLSRLVTRVRRILLLEGGAATVMEASHCPSDSTRKSRLSRVTRDPTKWGTLRVPA